jgi:hypothetical protein
VNKIILFEDFKDLSTGIKRLIITLGILLPVLVTIADNPNDVGYSLFTFIINSLMYWVVIFVIVWIYSGFKKDKKTRQN